jgi:hypothetical protein
MKQITGILSFIISFIVLILVLTWEMIFGAGHQFSSTAFWIIVAFCIILIYFSEKTRSTNKLNARLGEISIFILFNAKVYCCSKSEFR